MSCNKQVNKLYSVHTADSSNVINTILKIHKCVVYVCNAQFGGEKERGAHLHVEWSEKMAPLTQNVPIVHRYKCTDQTRREIVHFIPHYICDHEKTQS